MGGPTLTLRSPSVGLQGLNNRLVEDGELVRLEAASVLGLGRDLTVQHMGNNADYACYSRWQRDCPNARATGTSVLLLPSYPDYGEREVAKNVEAIERYFATEAKTMKAAAGWVGSSASSRPVLQQNR